MHHNLNCKVFIMNSPLTKTKIVCTIGPATDKPEMIENLIKAGMNVARINFSHGEQTEHGKTIQMIRDTAKKLETEVAILADLQGPKIRTNKFPGGSIQLENGSEVKIICSKEDGKEGVITTNFDPLVKDATVGERIPRLLSHSMHRPRNQDRGEAHGAYCAGQPLLPDARARSRIYV